ncbi:MAG: PP2C family serine/threonine-protein phosphatase, partial [Microcoleaceae cyanobacterium]
SNCPTDDLGWQNLLLDALRAAQGAIAQTAEKLEVELRELATTLILVIATPELVIGGQVGDGASVIGDRHGQIISLTMPDSGEHINETTFLIEENALEHIKIEIWHGQAKNLAIFSDGLQMLALKMPMATPHQPFFQPLFKFLQQVTDMEEANQQLEGFLRSPKVTERADDDLTLLLASLINQE